MGQEIVVKLKPSALKGRRGARAGPVPAVLEHVLERHPRAAVRQLFPGDDNPEPATLYVVTLPGSDAGRLLADLRKEPAVEYAHVPAARRPMKDGRG